MPVAKKITFHTNVLIYRLLKYECLIKVDVSCNRTRQREISAMRIFAEASPRYLFSFLSFSLFFSAGPINIILQNWFLSGTRRYVRCIFRAVPAEWNWPDDWLAVSDRTRDRASMEPRRIDTARAIIVPRQAFSFLREQLKSRYFFFTPDTRCISGSARTMRSICLRIAAFPVLFYYTFGIPSIIAHCWKYEKR